MCESISLEYEVVIYRFIGLSACRTLFYPVKNIFEPLELVLRGSYMNSNKRNENSKSKRCHGSGSAIRVSDRHCSLLRRIKTKIWAKDDARWSAEFLSSCSQEINTGYMNWNGIRLSTYRSRLAIFLTLGLTTRTGLRRCSVSVLSLSLPSWMCTMCMFFFNPTKVTYLFLKTA